MLLFMLFILIIFLIGTSGSLITDSSSGLPIVIIGAAAGGALLLIIIIIVVVMVAIVLKRRKPKHIDHNSNADERYTGIELTSKPNYSALSTGMFSNCQILNRHIIMFSFCSFSICIFIFPCRLDT